MCVKHLNDVAQQVKLPGMSTFLSCDMDFLSRRRLHYVMTIIDQLLMLSQHGNKGAGA